jgi:DNA-binding FrmR family transcriptional regulator
MAKKHDHPQDAAHVHPHRHIHSDEEKKALINRLARIAGHIESIRRMIEEDRDCSEVLVQLAAVRSAVNSAGKALLQNHIEQCLVDAVRHDDMESIHELNKSIEQFIK